MKQQPFSFFHIADEAARPGALQPNPKMKAGNMEIRSLVKWGMGETTGERELMFLLEWEPLGPNFYALVSISKHIL